MVDPGPSPDREDPERAEELRALARLLNDETAAPAPPPEQELEPVPVPPEELLSEASEAFEAQPEHANILVQQPDGLIDERFQLVGLLGGGPHGGVWRAKDHELQGREAALKILRQEWSHAPKLLIGLQAHLERSQSLTHESINRLRAVGRTGDGRIWLAFDLIQGEDLRSLLTRRGALSPRHALEIVRQVLLGLEQGHGLGLVHGDLRLDHVILEDRVPWSEDNPFSVGVQLLDYGLRPLFDGTRPGKQSDLLAVGRMLAELLTGTRFGADGPHWSGSQASPITASLSPRTRILLDTALAEDLAERFGDATEFRQAIESTREWRVSRGTPWAWVAASVVFIALATVFGLQLLKQRSAEVPVFAAEPGGVETVALSDYDEVKRDLELARDERATQTFRMQGQIDKFSREVEGLRSSSGELEARAASAESELERLSADSVRVQEDYEAVVAQLQASRTRVSELEAQNRPVPRIRDPLYLAAAYLERIIGQIGANDGAGAHATMRAFKKDTTLREAGITQTEFLDAWISSTLAWQRAAFETDDIERIPLMQRARRTFDDATARRIPFEAAAADWLRLDDEQGRPINLSGRVDTAFEQLGEKVRLASEDLDARLDERWSELSTDGFEDNPAELIAIANWFADDRLEDYADSFVETIRAEAEPHGTLNLTALASFERLPLWADAISSIPDLEWLNGGGEILLYAYAQRFYGGEAGEVLPPIDVRFRNNDASVNGWREELAIRTALLREDSPFPGPVGTRALYHSRTPEGLSSWIWQTVLYDDAQPSDTSRSWIVQQRFFDAEGHAAGQRKLRVYLRGKRFYEKDIRSSEILNLARLDSSIQLRSWVTDSLPAVPDTLPVRPEQVAEFQELLSASEWRCLVNAQGTGATWYSPDLGLVRHDDPGRITRQLVYAEIPR